MDATTEEGREAPSGRPAPELSVVITCYYEEHTIDEFHERLSRTLQSLGRSHEIIMVNDGSTDGTFEKLKEIFRRDENVSLIADLFKNAGQLKAWTAGVTHARGRTILLLDSDLQLAPEELPLLLAEYDKGADVVSGYRTHRRDSIFRMIPSKIANMIMRMASQADFRDFGCTFKLYNADLIRAFELGPFKPFVTTAIISRAGRCKEVPVSHEPRGHGKSGWTFSKLWEFNMDNTMILLQRPFQIIAGFCAFAAILLVIRLGIELLMPIQIFAAVTNNFLLYVLIISLLLIVSMLCLAGEFAIRSFKASLGIPAYIIREKIER